MFGKRLTGLFHLLLGLGVASLACQAFPSTPTPQMRPTLVSASPVATTAAPAPLSPAPTAAVLPAATATAAPPRPAESHTLWLPALAREAVPPTQTRPPLPASSPTVTLTPYWPEALASPGRSKLGLQVMANNSPWIIEFVRRGRPAVVVAVDDVGWLAEVERLSPETVTIGRFSATHQEMHSDPGLAAQALVAEQLVRYQLNSQVDFWEGWNEPDLRGDMAWYAAFEEARVRLLDQHGFKAAVGAFASGEPDWEGWVAFLPAIEAALEHGGILTLHECAAPTLDVLVGSPLPGWPSHPQRGPLALRYRWWYEELLIPRGLVVPLVISQAGIDGTVTGAEEKGWQDFTGYWEAQGWGGGPEVLLNQLQWYDSELRMDDYVLGFAVMTAGGTGSWSSYDLNPILPELALYLAREG